MVSRVQERVVKQRFETVELLQQALGQALLPYSERILLAYGSSLVSHGGWRPSMLCDINNPDRYYFPTDPLDHDQEYGRSEAFLTT